MRSAFARLTAAFALTASAAVAQIVEDEHVFVFGALTIEHPWARAAVAGNDTLAFTEIINAGPPDRLLSAATPVAASVEIVGLAITGDRIETIPVGPIEIPAGEFELDPGGLGLALRDLVQPLVQGTEFEMTLTFEQAGEVTIHVLVEAANAMAHGHAH